MCHVVRTLLCSDHVLVTHYESVVLTWTHDLLRNDRVLCSGANMMVEVKGDECVVLYCKYIAKYNVAGPSSYRISDVGTGRD